MVKKPLRYLLLDISYSELLIWRPLKCQRDKSDLKELIDHQSITAPLSAPCQEMEHIPIFRSSNRIGLRSAPLK